jgi:hypothetical protein
MPETPTVTRPRTSDEAGRDGGSPLACFATGTRILTTRGEVPVEALAVGDLAATLSGRFAPIGWIGVRRTSCARHPLPWRVMPVRVRAGAFAETCPRRDLLLSPDHAIYIDNVLVRVRHLLNDMTIRQELADEQTYWHIELDRHDVVVAEGLLVESFRDAGLRGMFDNGGDGEIAPLHPDFDADPDLAGHAPPHNAPPLCAPVVSDGHVLAAIRHHLTTRAVELGHRPPLALEVPVRAAGTLAVAVPGVFESVVLVTASRQRGRDTRHLGALVTGVSIEGQAIRLRDARLAAGFHDIEFHDGTPVRWTDGRARLLLGPATADRLVTLQIARVMQPGKASGAAASRPARAGGPKQAAGRPG